MSNRSNFTCALSLLAIALVVVLATPAWAAKPVAPPPPPLDQGGDDLFLIQAAVAPNVVLFIDNSKSMAQIEWHPEFDPDKVPDAGYCTVSSDLESALSLASPNLDPNTTYRLTSDENNIECDTPARSRRTVYGPLNPTFWDGRYMMWYLGLDENDATEGRILDEIENAVAKVVGCTVAGGAGPFAEKYRRTRFEATKQVLLDLLCVAETKNVRFGTAAFREVSPLVAGGDPNGGFVSEDLGRSNPNHAAQLEASIKNETIRLTDGTPLSETLFQLYTYWMPRVLADMPLGLDGTPFPIYEFDKQGNRVASNKWFEDTFKFECEKAFFVIVTDGLPSRDNFEDNAPLDTALGYSAFANQIGNYHVETPVDEIEDPMTADEATYYLDDIAMYMYDKDFRPDIDGDQTIDTYTVGYASDAATDAYLRKTAEVGNGIFYHVQDGDELTNALIGALNDIIEKAASFTAATVPSARTADGADFYQSYFFPRGKNAFWEGHVRAWKIDALGEIKDKNNVCALEDPDPGECNSGPFKPSAQFFWDAADEVPIPASRKLYVSKAGATAGSLPPAFTSANISAADLLLDPFTVPPAQAPNSPLYAVNGSSAITEEGLADEVVEAARGCFFGTGVAANVATPVACAERPATLGDIFHSNAIVVGAPKAASNEPSYNAFKSHYGTRSRRLFAGTNAGFLEAIDTGSFVSSPAPGKYDEGTGAEVFGFMPWEARKNIKNLPIDSATSRVHYVDGDVSAADAWIHPTVSTATKDSSGSEWRTIAVGAMREGGHHVYALDVTNPDAINQPGGGGALPYPGYGWEFPTEVDVPGDFAFMGEIWSEPIITKVRLHDPADSTKTVERWVAIVTAGYDAASDPNPTAVTGVVNTYDATSTLARGVYILDLKTGKVIGEKKFGSIADPQPILHATLSTPAVLDLNFDGFADTIYLVDMGGNVWKWAIGAVGEDRVNDASSLRTQPNWPFKKFFSAAAVTIGANKYYKNLMFAPAVAYNRGKIYLAFGSGERRNLPFKGDLGATTENNRFYVVIDSDPFEVASPALATLTEADLTNFSGSEAAASFSNQGFWFSVANGEKFVTNVEIFAGTVIAATFIPTTNANPCTTRGDGALYAFDLVSGEGYFEDGSNNPDRSITLGVGLPTDPKVSVGVDGKDNKIVIEKSGSDIQIIDQDNINLSGGTLYWKQE